MSYMTPENAAYLDVLRQLNPTMGGMGGGGVGGTAVGSPVSSSFLGPVGAGPVSGNIPGLSAPNVVADVAAQSPEALAGVAGGGGGGGFLSGLAGLGGGAVGEAAPLAGLGARLAAARGGMLTTYGLPVAAGLVTDSLVNKGVKAVGLNQNSLLSDVGEGAAGGAVAGGMIGALGLPIPVIGEATTLGGAALGGVIGGGAGLLGHFFGGGGDKQQQVNFGRESTSLLDEAKQAGLSPQTASDLYNQYGIYLRSQLATTRGTDQEQASRQEAYQKLAGNVQLALQYQAQQQARQQSSAIPGFSNMGPRDYAALQALSAAYMKPYTDQSIATSRQEHDILSGLGNKIGGSTGDAIKAQATAASAAADRTALAYGAQAQMAPTMFGFQQQQSQMQALASQLQAQAISNYLQQGPNATPSFDWSSGGGLGGLSGILPSPGGSTSKTPAKKLP